MGGARPKACVKEGEDIENKISEVTISAGSEPQYVISDNAHNLVRGASSIRP